MPQDLLKTANTKGVIQKARATSCVANYEIMLAELTSADSMASELNYVF